jgi:arylsulfatase A-like enzyme/Tfp pilus assembly protein PilF
VPSTELQLPRRRLISLNALVLVAALALWYWQRNRVSFPDFEKNADQNVLLVTIDTLRGDALRSYGGRADTPNLDRLAAEGVRYTFAHAHAVVTLPSHTSIVTGRYPYEHGVRDNAGFRLSESATTLAEMLHAKGWATGAFVGAFPLDRQFGLAQGFDVYDDLSGRELPAAEFAFPERRAEEVVAAARAWVDQQQKPWFLWVHVFDPHAPYAAPAPFDTRYPADRYAGEVAYVDQALGPLLELAHRGPRRTAIVVTADHGEGLGDHGESTHGVFAYESTLRVPLILAQVGPESRPARRPAVVDAPVRHIDIVPTIADLVAMGVADDLHGRTLLSAGNGDEGSRESYFEAMTTMLKRGWAPLRGVLVGREKYIDLPIQELYDLGPDPHELKNLAVSTSARARTMSTRLENMGAALPGEPVRESAAVRARLQSLGYFSGSAPRKSRYGVEDDPKQLIEVDRLMLDGIEAFRAGRTGQALAAYRDVIAKRPDMALAYRRLAFIQWESGATRDAIATLRQAIDRNGPDIDIEIRLGTYLAETGSPAEAIPLLERATKADPENTEALNALGIAYARAGKSNEAVALFQRILSMDPRDAFALENLGTVLMQRNDLAGAQAAFTRAATNDPRSSRAHAGLGAVALHMGQRDRAIDYWRRAVELDSTNYDALYNLGTELLNAGRQAEARIYLDRFVRTAPPAFYTPEIEKIRRILR